MNILIVFRNIYFSVCMSISKRVAILLTVIVNQKEGLNFFHVLVSDRKRFFFNKNLTTQNRHVELPKTILTSNIRLHVIS